MAVLPWRSQVRAVPACQYVALLSYLPLESFRRFPWLLVYTARIRRQLRLSPGLIGYSLRAEFGKRRFWTLSAWQDDAALEAFVTTSPHAAVMQALAPDMGATRFTRWTVEGSQLPLEWGEALGRARDG